MLEVLCPAQSSVGLSLTDSAILIGRQMSYNELWWSFVFLVIFIQKWLPYQTKPNIWQMTFHFSLGLNLTVLKFKQNTPDPVGSQVSEYVG